MISEEGGTFSTVSGTFGVDMYNQGERTITLLKQSRYSDGEYDTYDPTDKENSEETLTYTYENGVLRLFLGDNEYTKK